MPVTRDPFARTELHRTLVATTQACAWCGGRRRTAKLWRYRTEADGLRTRGYVLEGLFCSAFCFRSYHA
jgi:hypothetical protein